MESKGHARLGHASLFFMWLSRWMVGKHITVLFCTLEDEASCTPKRKQCNVAIFGLEQYNGILLDQDETF